MAAGFAGCDTHSLDAFHKIRGMMLHQPNFKSLTNHRASLSHVQCYSALAAELAWSVQKSHRK